MTAALGEMTSEDLSYWMAYAELEPFGPLEDSRRASVLATASLAPWCKRADLPRPGQLFPELAGRRERREQTPEEMSFLLRARTVAAGGTVIEGQGGSPQPGPPPELNW